MAKMSKPVIQISLGRPPSSAKSRVSQRLFNAAARQLNWSPRRYVGFEREKSEWSYPALKLAQHELADHIHATLAVIEARNEGKLFAAMVFEDLGVFLRDFFQRFQAIGRESRRDNGNAPHAIVREFLQGLVGIGLKPFVEPEARLEGQEQL